MKNTILKSSLIRALLKQNYKKALKLIASMFNEQTPEIDLFFIKIYCEIELKQHKKAMKTCLMASKFYPSHHVFKNMCMQLKKENVITNPMHSFVESYLHFHQFQQQFNSPSEFDQLMHFLTIQPSIK